MRITTDQIMNLGPCLPYWTRERVKSYIGDGVSPERLGEILNGLKRSDTRWLLVRLLSVPDRARWAKACADHVAHMKGEWAAKYAELAARHAAWCAELAARHAAWCAEHAARHAERAAERAAKHAAEYAAEYAELAAEYAAKHAAEYAAEYAELAAEYAGHAAKHAEDAAGYAAADPRTEHRWQIDQAIQLLEKQSGDFDEQR